MFSRRKAAPPPQLTNQQRAIVNRYLERVVNNANGNVTGLGIIINATTRRKITKDNIKKLNNGEAKKLYNKIERGNSAINNRFKKRGSPVGLVINLGKRTATAAAGGVAGLAAGVVGGFAAPGIERQLILDVPALVTGDWEKSRIIAYIAEQMAESTQLSPEKIRALIIKILTTKKVLNKNKEQQINWGRNIGSQVVSLYKNYSSVPANGQSRFKNVKSGFIKGLGRAYFPRTAAARNYFGI